MPTRGVTASYFCHTLVVVNPRSQPAQMAVQLSGLLAASGLPPTHPGVSTFPATRLFNGMYAVNLSLTPGVDVAELRDMIDERATNVYRVGCDTVGHADGNRSNNLVVDGDVEGGIDPGAPGG